MLGCGVTFAGFPLGDRPARNMQLLGQACLCQAKLGAKRQYALAKGIVALTIYRPVHGRLPFYRLIQMGKPRRVPRSAALSLVEQGRAEATSATVAGWLAQTPFQ